MQKIHPLMYVYEYSLSITWIRKMFSRAAALYTNALRLRLCIEQQQQQTYTYKSKIRTFFVKVEDIRNINFNRCGGYGFFLHIRSSMDMMAHWESCACVWKIHNPCYVFVFFHFLFVHAFSPHTHTLNKAAKYLYWIWRSAFFHIHFLLSFSQYGFHIANFNYKI